ncbi:MAG: hypothetical protein J6N20_00225 [Pseudomonas sp.]|nr:hypothetical protein [Pseudomonas sp.]
MKKAINKTERDHVVKALVVQSAVKTGQDIINRLGKLRAEIRGVLLSNWEDSFPGIRRADQLALLQSHGATCLTFKPTTYVLHDKDKAQAKNEFCKLYWSNTGTDTEKRRVASLAACIVDACSGTAGVLSENVTANYGSMLMLSPSYTDLIHGTQPIGVYLGDAPLPKEFDPVLNSRLSLLHKQAMVLLTEFRDLIYATEDAYQVLYAALVPVKSVAQLAELMPESVQFFPPSMTYVKPTKEIADPTAINDIRAKLKAGLPI